MAASAGELLGTPRGLPHTRWQDLMPESDVGEDHGARGDGVFVESKTDVDWAHRQIKLAKPKNAVFFNEARRSFKMYAGDQVDEADRDAMSRGGRPIITLNEVQKLIKVVDGIERRVPLAIYYLARDPTDAMASQKAEVKTKAREWVYDACYGSFEMARAKKDRDICGMGWTETYITRAKNPAGLINIKRFSPFEAMFPSTSAENLNGSRWRGRRRKMPVEEAMKKWPKMADIILASSGDQGTASAKDFPVKADLVKYVRPWIMTEPTNKGGDMPRDPGEIQVTDFQYTKSGEGYYFKDPITEKFDWKSKNEYFSYARVLRDNFGALPKNVEQVAMDEYWRIFFMNDSFVLAGPEKMPINGFSLNCVTGDWDEDRKIFFGLMRTFMDPQLLIDKLASSAVEILGAQTKGGLDYEQGAMSDPQVQEYRRTSTRPGAMNQFKRDALKDGRVRAKTPPVVPAGIVTLLDFGIKELQNLSGLTESLLASNDSSGAGLRQRLSMGLLLLAGYFDSSARFEREEGETVQQYLKLVADDRWVRVGGPGNEQAVQLIRGDFDEMLDTTVDDTEQDPTLRRLYMDQITQLAPTLIRTNNFIPELLDWYLLPYQFRSKLKQAIQKNSETQMQMRMMGIGTGRGKSRTQEEVKGDEMRIKGQAALAFAKAEHLKRQSDNLSSQAVSDDLKQIVDSLIGFHKASMDQQKGHVDRARAAADIYKTLNPPQQGAN